MNQAAAEQLISDLFQYALGRKPGPHEVAKWTNAMTAGMAAQDMVRAFYLSEEFQRKNAVRLAFPAGHYHSPIVDPRNVKEYFAKQKKIELKDIAGISVDVDSMRSLWLKYLTFIQSTPFTDNPNPANRYHYTGGPYQWGDAITLRMMINHYRPRRIVEIGSGYSTACMLDSFSHASVHDSRVTCIEPYPDRLRSLLRPADYEKLTIIEQAVQEIPSDIVEELEPNDILFIDSTHVMKTGSDVHYEFFTLLPKVRSGVVVHFHDITFPFEYPSEWIFERNYSWNEAYVLRAFLMYNAEFEVVFWNSLFARKFNASIRTECPTFLRNPGGSIWLKRA